MDDHIKIKLTESNGGVFFETLENYLQSKIPLTLKNVLIFNRYDSAVALSKFDDDSITEVQECMRTIFDKKMLEKKEKIEDYLGKFAKLQEKFVLVSGEIRLIKFMVQTCQRLFSVEPEEPEPDNISVSEDRNVTDLSRLIGSYMIIVFNDALRITLSGWSWPSRHVAMEKANNFKFGRNDSLSKINLQYVTPSNHKEFLNSIVMSDVETFVGCIGDALAISFRVDGSTDRSQKHNVFAMMQIVKKDTTMNTFCLGFGVPKIAGAEGYLLCLQDVVTRFLPWEEFFALITSIVTDGESLNRGHLNGLVVKLLNLRISSGSTLPLLSIWCVPHRTNLAWKSISLNNTIGNLISRATKVSKHFHNSAKRTHKLEDLARLNGLSAPLRYPSFFNVRWIEFVFNLFNAILRNWRASIKYFEAENLQSQLNYWTRYDTLHALTFLTDVLGLLKRFQKSCQSDTITLFEVSELSKTLFEELKCCKDVHISGGWEELFMKEIEKNGSDVFLCGIKLKKLSVTRTRRAGASLTQSKRKFIIQSFVSRLKMRLKLDDQLLKTFEPFVQLSSTTSQESLQSCHRTIAPDLEEDIFIAEYYCAAELLDNHQFDSTLKTLQKLAEIRPNDFHILKTVMARIIVAKPHSADVERLINVYNKFKTPERQSISQSTLLDYLHINTNMCTLEQFDPTSAVNYWLVHKKRRPKSNNKSHQQEWLNGVFEQPLDVVKNTKISSKIKF